jgi:hypothetical protein
MGTAQRGSGVPASDANRNLEGAQQRLRNLAVPESRIREVREKGVNPRTLDCPAPATGDVIEKKIINGQRVQAGQELYRIADHGHLWVIADVAEGDLRSASQHSKIEKRERVASVAAHIIGDEQRRQNGNTNQQRKTETQTFALESKKKQDRDPNSTEIDQLGKFNVSVFGGSPTL